jgi:ATP/maltotriose-dependent transcriptional regulator MalT
VQAQTLAGNLERALELCDVAMERAATPLAVTTVSYCRALPLLWQGRVSEAMTELHSAVEEPEPRRRRFSRSAHATMLLCLIEHDDLSGAEEQLRATGNIDELRDLEDAHCMAARAQLRLVQGRPREALDGALRTAEAIGDAIKTLAYCQWRTTAALAALAMDQRDRALALAEDALQLNDTTGVLHERIRARWVLGLCRGGKDGLGLLQEAVDIGVAQPPRLETARALVELGSALRRANRRAAARAPLQRAADMALAGGATALHNRAHTELAAAGARPRREWLTRGPESLTPSERRIAELAARGLSNREIAQALFVTPKTVEYHLRNTYRKLEIEGRGDLTPALGHAGSE